MTRRRIANGISWLGIACSLAFWAWIGIFPHLPFHQRGAWMRLSLGVSDVWPGFWLMGIVLPLAATVLGSWRWMFAALVPIVSCAAAIFASGHVP